MAQRHIERAPFGRTGHLSSRVIFGAAGIGMLIGTAIYLYALRVLPNDRPRRESAAAARPSFASSDWYAFTILWLLFIPGCLFWATYEQSGNTVVVWSVDRLNRLVSLGPLSFTLSVGQISRFGNIVFSS